MAEESAAATSGWPLDDAFAAEEAAAEAIESLIDEGGKLVHERYLRTKAIPFAANAVSKVLLTELVS